MLHGFCVYYHTNPFDISDASAVCACLNIHAQTSSCLGLKSLISHKKYVNSVDAGTDCSHTIYVGHKSQGHMLRCLEIRFIASTHHHT